MRPIMLATDGSPSAEAATREAIDLAVRLELPLLVACVAHDPTPTYGYYGYAQVAAEMRKLQEERIAELFAHVEAEAADVDVTCETVRLHGPIGDELCKLARARGARLIVIGAHGWGPVGRLVHGSVSTHVVRHATTPVLVVHAGDRSPIAGVAAGSRATA